MANELDADFEPIEAEPVGPEQETFGGAILGGGTDTALTYFIESINAAAAPLLNAQGMAALYAENALLVHPLYGLPESVAGRSAIERHFARIGEIMQSLTYVESRRRTDGRNAVWEGFVEGVQAGSRRRMKVPIVLKLEFDDDDLVCRLHSFYSIDLVRRQLGDFEFRR